MRRWRDRSPHSALESHISRPFWHIRNQFMDIRQHKYSKPYNRLIVINDKTWSWRIAVPNIWIRSPDGKKTIHTNSFEVSGISLDHWYGRDQYPEEPPKGSKPEVIQKYKDTCFSITCDLMESERPSFPIITPKDIRRVVEEQSNVI
jgi:hypothetical protein